MKNPAFLLVISNENNGTLFLMLKVFIVAGGEIHVIVCFGNIFCFLQTGLNMESNNITWWPVNNSGNMNSSYLNNHTIYPVYIFTPAGDTAKSVLCSILLAVGSVGFLGNCLVFYFLCQKTTSTPFQMSRFMRNLNLYIRSLSLSDLLSCLVSLPLLCIQIFFDVFQSGWPCKIVRYFHFIFPAITMNNLIVINVEKYLSTRAFPRTFSSVTVRKMIVSAWVLGIVVMVIPAAAYDGIKVDLNQTHFTVICRNGQNFYPFKIALVIFPIQYIFPSVLVIYMNICLTRTVWTKGKRRIDNAASNASKAKNTAARIKGTSLLIAVTFAFTIPYLLFVTNVAYTQIAKPKRGFATDFITRYAAGATAYCSSVINFILYFAQMKDFREFLKKVLLRSRTGTDAAEQPEIFTFLRIERLHKTK